MTTVAIPSRNDLSSLAIAIICVSLGALVMAVALLVTRWENGYTQLMLVIGTAVVMTFILARNIFIEKDPLRLSSTIPMAYLFFLMPNSVALALEFRTSSLYLFKVLQHTISIYDEDTTAALAVMFAGSLAYGLGVVIGNRTPGLDDRLVSRAPARSWSVRAGRPLVLGSVLVTLFLIALLFLTGGPTGIVALIVDPVARDELQSTSLTALLISLFLGYLATISVAYGRDLVNGVFPLRPSSLILYGLAIAMALPLASRGYVLSVMIYPVLLFHYLQKRIPATAVLVAALTLPAIATALRLLRVDAVGDFSTTNSFTEFFSESNMVSMFSAAMGALRSGKIDYTYGLDLALFALWFIPRALWPGKYLPLDYRLTMALDISDNGRAYGSPVTIFGGLYLNLTLIGMVVALLLLGYIIARCDQRLSVHTPRGLFVRIMLFTFLVDLTRVGDVSRELSVLFLQSSMFIFVASVVRLPRVKHK